MNEYIYPTDYGTVTVKEYLPPYDNEIIDVVGRLAQENKRQDYTDNYEMSNHPGSLGDLLTNNKFKSIYLSYLNDEFYYFLGTRIAEDTGMFLTLVRTFSKLGEIKKPIHTSYVLRLQMELAKSSGFTECSFTMNTGSRDALAELMKKRYLVYKHNPNPIKALALENMSKFEYKGIHVINYCDQHVFTAKL